MFYYLIVLWDQVDLGDLVVHVDPVDLGDQWLRFYHRYQGNLEHQEDLDYPAGPGNPVDLVDQLRQMHLFDLVNQDFQLHQFDLFVLEYPEVLVDHLDLEYPVHPEVPDYLDDLEQELTLFTHAFIIFICML